MVDSRFEKRPRVKILNEVMNQQSKQLYECQECHLKYKYKECAEKCEAWCREHHSCNLEIIAHAEKFELA